ncbi:acyl-CoA dehydrogenase family protein [Gordonibacter sp.]|uniref:acyl-CoA dehydrogenase family protein n=2 Tax=Gordonibacter sp. TaxID=1968902 RepID=UPI002FCB1B65
MDFRFTDEQELLVESIEEFVARNMPEELINEMYETGVVPDALSKAWMDAGFGLMGVPEEYGGTPCDNTTLLVMYEALFRASACFTPFCSNAMALFDVIGLGPKEQVERAVAAYKETGRPLFSFAISEPGAGSDNKGMTSYTKKQTDGTYLLNGTKTFVTNGEDFPELFVIAKDEDPARENKSMSIWTVPLNLPGVSTAKLHKIGQTIMPFCEVYFDDVVVTEAMRAGTPGAGFSGIMRQFELERCLCAAQSVGWAHAALSDAANYATERMAFGKPIADFQLIQLKLTEMETIVQNVRNMMYKTLWKLDNDIPANLDAALLKRYSGIECTRVASEALQIHGGLGYTTETRLGRIFLDCRGNEIAGGTDEVMVHIAGRQIPKKYKK